MPYICIVIRLISIFLISGFLLQAFSKQLIVTGYYVNKNFIASFLCENKNFPEKHCEGKCQLKKELQKDESRQQDSSTKVKTIVDVLFSEKAESAVSVINTPFVRLYYHFSTVIPTTAANAVFHPPSC